MKDLFYQKYITSNQAGVNIYQKNIDKAFQGRKSYIEYIITKFIPKNKASTIIDLGCGSGIIPYFLNKQGYTNVIGIDISKDQIMYGKSLGVKGIVEGDIIEYVKKTESDTVDVIFLMDVIEHFTKEELLSFLKDINRILKSSGRVVIHIPNAEGIFGARVRYGDLTHELAFTPTSINQLLRVVDFKEIKVFEDRPTGKSLKAFLRKGLWTLLTFYFRLLYMVESGIKKPVLSQNMLVIATKLK